MIFLGLFMEFKLCTTALLECNKRAEFPLILKGRCNDFIEKSFWPFLEGFRPSIFQENNHRKSIHVDREMKQMLISKLGIV